MPIKKKKDGKRRSSGGGKSGHHNASARYVLDQISQSQSEQSQQSPLKRQAEVRVDAATRESKVVGDNGEHRDIEMQPSNQSLDKSYNFSDYYTDVDGDRYLNFEGVASSGASTQIPSLNESAILDQSVTSEGLTSPQLTRNKNSDVSMEGSGGDSEGGVDTTPSDYSTSANKAHGISSKPRPRPDLSDVSLYFGPSTTPIRKATAADVGGDDLRVDDLGAADISHDPTPSVDEEVQMDSFSHLVGEPPGAPRKPPASRPGGGPPGAGKPAGVGERKGGDPDPDPNPDPDPDDPGGGGNRNNIRDNLEGIADAAPKTTPFNFTQGYTDERRLPGMAQSRDINIGFDEKMDKLKREEAAQAAQQGAPAMMTPQLRDLSTRTKFPFRIIHHAAVEKFLLTVDFPSFMKFVRDHHPDLIRTAAALDIPATELIQNSKSLLVFWGDKIGIKRLKYSSNSKLKDISDEYQEILMCVMGLVISAAVTPMLSNRGQSHIANTTREVDQVAQANANVGSNSTLANATMQNTGPTASWEQDMRSLSKMFPTGKNQQTLLFS